MKAWIRKAIRFIFFSYSKRPMREKGIMLLISFLITLMLWFSVTLNESYEVACEFNIDMEAIPEDIQITQEKFPKLSAVVEGPGFDILLGKFQNRNDTIFLPFHHVMKSGYIISEKEINSVASKFPPQIRIKNLYPDTINISYEKKISKRVPLVSKAVVSLAPEYQLKEQAELTPDSVVIIGPQTILDTTHQWFTVDYNTNIVSETIQSIYIPVLDTFTELSVIPKTAQLTIHAQRYTQKNINVPILIQNLPEGTDVSLEKDYVEIACLVPLERYENLKETDYMIKIDYQTLDPSIPFLIPEIDFLPSYVKPVFMNPAQINYVIISQLKQKS